MGARKAAAIAGVALLVLAVATPLSAQTLGTGYPDRYPPPLPKRRGPRPPPLSFTLDGTIPLLGPVSAKGAGLAGGQVVLHGPLGFVSVPLTPGAGPTPASAPPRPEGTDAEGWVYSPDGGWRFRTLPAGLVVAPRWWGNRRGGRHDWSLRVGGATLAPPLLIKGRVLFGSLDNQVYAVRADNGHRLWAVDVGERLSRPLALWHGAVEADGETREVDAVLVAPDDSLGVVALDLYDGTRLATFPVDSLPEGNAIVSAPLVASDGRVVVAHQGYAPEEASLLVLRLGPAPSDSSPGPPGGVAPPPL